MPPNSPCCESSHSRIVLCQLKCRELLPTTGAQASSSLAEQVRAETIDVEDSFEVLAGLLALFNHAVLGGRLDSCRGNSNDDVR